MCGVYLVPNLLDLILLNKFNFYFCKWQDLSIYCNIRSERQYVNAAQSVNIKSSRAIHFALFTSQTFCIPYFSYEEKTWYIASTNSFLDHPMMMVIHFVLLSSTVYVLIK